MSQRQTGSLVFAAPLMAKLRLFHQEPHSPACEATPTSPSSLTRLLLEGQRQEAIGPQRKGPLASNKAQDHFGISKDNFIQIGRNLSNKVRQQLKYTLPRLHIRTGNAAWGLSQPHPPSLCSPNAHPHWPPVPPDHPAKHDSQLRPNPP